MFNFLKPKTIDLTKEEKLKMIKKFKNAVNNYIEFEYVSAWLVADGIKFDEPTKDFHINFFRKQKRELLRIITKWEKELIKENK